MQRLQNGQSLLTNQIRRAAVSVTLNIAESHGKYHYKDRIKYLHQARGSLVEVWAAARIAKKLGYENTNTERQVKDLRIKLANFINVTQQQMNND